MKFRLLYIAPLLLQATAFASTLGITITKASSDVDARDYTIGWKFSTASPLKVTALGYYDAGGDGLLDRHNVGIFSSSGTLLVSTTVGAGTADPLVADWRMRSITPYTLVAGTYVIGAEQASSSDPIVFNADPFIPGLGITILNEKLYDLGPGLIFPALDGLEYPQPNFQASAVPEPSTVLTSGFGLCLAAWAVRRRRKA